MNDRTIPNLDEEVERLSNKEAYNRIKKRLEPDYGLQLRFFESGYGEWYEYYRENPSDDGLLYYRSGEAVQQRPVRGDILSTIGRDQIQSSEHLKDIYRVPLDRMPEWGDGSVHYKCHVCRSPIIATERTHTKSGAVHTACKID